MLKRRLFTPGPVPVPERVQLAMAQPIINHRAPDFLPLFAACKRGLQRLFQTESPVLLFAASGTGAMDAAVSNLLSPGDHALVIRGGSSLRVGCPRGAGHTSGADAHPALPDRAALRRSRGCR